MLRGRVLWQAVGAIGGGRLVTPGASEHSTHKSILAPAQVVMDHKRWPEIMQLV